jgi:hypothetical protein
MEEQVHAPRPDEEVVIEERVHLLDDEDNLEDIDSLLDDL